MQRMAEMIILPGPKCSLPWQLDGWLESLQDLFTGFLRKLTCRVNLGVPWARVKFIRNAVAVVVPKASITRSIMVVVHLLRVGNEGTVVLNVWNPIVVRIRITVVADAIVVGVKLIGVVGIGAIVILVRYSIQVPVKAIITCVAWKLK